MRFTDILAEHGVLCIAEGNRHCRAGWVQLDCPFCSKNSGEFYMGYNLAKGYVNCYRCGHHRLIDTVMQLTGLSFSKCKALLMGVEHVRDIAPVAKRGKLVVPEGVRKMLPAHREYLRERRIDPEMAEQLWGLKGIGFAAELSWRIFIPITYQGRMVSWTTRTIKPNVDLRYRAAGVNEEEMNHKELLLGEEMATHAICVVEGPMDAIRIGPGAVATCGTAISRAQQLRMAEYPVIGICFDNEGPAQQRAKRLASDLSIYGGVVSNICLDAKDAGEASERELQSLRKGLGL